MKSLILILTTLLFSANSFATIGMICAGADADGQEAAFVSIPQLNMTGQVTSWNFANEVMFKGKTYKQYENKEQNDISVKMVESWCDWEMLEHPRSCMVWVKVDLNGNGKFEFEFEVKGELPASENPEEETVYQGMMIDYTTPGQKIKTKASCSVGP